MTDDHTNYKVGTQIQTSWYDQDTGELVSGVEVRVKDLLTKNTVKVHIPAAQANAADAQQLIEQALQAERGIHGLSN